MGRIAPRTAAAWSSAIAAKRAFPDYLARPQLAVGGHPKVHYVSYGPGRASFGQAASALGSD